MERRRDRDIVIDVDHGSNNKHAFDWALIHFCRLADAIHLIHVVSSMDNKIVYDANQVLMQKLAIETFEVAMVRTSARIVEGDLGKEAGDESLIEIVELMASAGLVGIATNFDRGNQFSDCCVRF